MRLAMGLEGEASSRDGTHTEMARTMGTGSWGKMSGTEHPCQVTFIPGPGDFLSGRADSLGWPRPVEFPGAAWGQAQPGHPQPGAVFAMGFLVL